MRACVRLNDEVCLEYLAAEKSLCQGHTIALRRFNNLSAAVIHVVCTRFKAGKVIMDTLVHLRKKTGVGGGQPPESQSW